MAGLHHVPSALFIRRYRDSDRDVVWDLHVLGLEQSGSNAGPGPWNNELHDIAAVYLENRGEFLVREYAGDSILYEKRMGDKPAG